MPAPQSLIRRLACTAALLSHLAAIGVWPAMEMAQPRSHEPHVESPAGAKCPPAHDESHCQICQTSTLRVTTAPVVTAELAPGVEIRTPGPSGETPLRSVSTRHQRSRSPPTLSA